MKGLTNWFLVFSVSVSLSVCFKNPQEVCTDNVCFKGKLESGLQKPYEAFFGIPYAEPPVGDLRFKNPIFKIHRERVWNATYSRSECMQLGSATNNEDCLYLNIYRPITKKKLPVLVFIHGGSFKNGNISPLIYGPEYIMDNQQVILVNIQYRLGIFGFLSSGDVNCQGNFGLKDQSLALKWIKKNIRKFGGNPHSITLSGQSAGSASVHYQIMSPTSNGLFDKAVLMSGTALAAWSIIRDPLKQFKEIAEYANFTSSSTKDIVNQLKTLSSETVLDLSTKIFIFTPIVGAFRPCIEGNWRGAFITKDPEYIWKNGKYQQRSLLITNTAVEGAFMYDFAFKESVVEQFNADIDMSIALSSEIPIDLTGLVESFYLDNETISSENGERLIDFYSDWAALYPTYKTVMYYLQYANLRRNPVYLAKFDFNSTYSLANVFIQSEVYLGQAHMDDVIYLFDVKLFGMEFRGSSAESQMTQKMVDLVVTFAKTSRIPQAERLQKCTKNNYCDYVVFERNTSTEPNSVEIKISNDIDLEMVNLYETIESNMK